jgi:hypothetical protein
MQRHHRVYPPWFNVLLETGKLSPGIETCDLGAGTHGTPLGFAIFAQHTKAVRLLIQLGVDVNAQCLFRKSGSILPEYPLCNAIAHNTSDIVKLLLENGADYRTGEPNAASWAMSMIHWGQGREMWDLIITYNHWQRRRMACCWVMQQIVPLRDMAEITTKYLWINWDI